MIDRARAAARTRSGRLLTIIVTALIGACIGLLFGARVDTEIGPADVTLALQPGLRGDTVIDVAPLGTLTADTHDGPIQLHASLEQIQLPKARKLLDSPGAINDLAADIGNEIRHGLIVLAVKTLIVTTVSAGLLALVLFRSPSRAGWSALTATGMSLAVFGAAGLTFNDRAMAEPRYTGILTAAPSVVGDAQSIMTRFSKYREELARLVANVSRLYETGLTLPVYQADPSTVRILSVSDIHLNPAAWDVIHSIVKQFQIQAIVDSGDLTDHGTQAENKFVKEISTFDIPYIFVRGNHDSRVTQKAVERQKNARVLDNGFTTFKGIRFFGVGDPRFTPDKATRGEPEQRNLTELGRQYAHRLVSAPDPTDVVVVHDPTEGGMFSGTTPLVLSGHVHRRSTKLLPTGTRLFVQGSTGGAGLRGLEHEKPTPVECSVLYFNRTSHRLQAWDDITLGGFGKSSVEMTRHLEHDPNRRINLAPTSPTPSTPPGSPSGGGTSTGTPTARATRFGG